MSDEIIVTQPENVVNVVNEQPIIQITAPGPQGAPGPAGAQGPPGVGSQYLRWVYSALTGNYNVDFATDTFIAVDSSVHPITITLEVSTAPPTLGANQGYGLFVKSMNPQASYFPVILMPQAGQYIEVSGKLYSSYTLQAGEGVQLISTGSGYSILTNTAVSPEKLSQFYDIYNSV